MKNVIVAVVLLFTSFGFSVAAQEETEVWICPSGKTQCQNICWNTYDTTISSRSCSNGCTNFGGGGPYICTLYPLPAGGAACEGPGEDFYGDLQDCLNRCDIQYQCYPVT